MTDPVVDLTQRLLVADEVAELLNIKRSRVYELSRREQDPLPSLKLGKAKRFSRSQVEQWLGRQSRPAA